MSGRKIPGSTPPEKTPICEVLVEGKIIKGTWCRKIAKKKENKDMRLIVFPPEPDQAHRHHPSHLARVMLRTCEALHAQRCDPSGQTGLIRGAVWSPVLPIAELAGRRDHGLRTGTLPSPGSS